MKVKKLEINGCGGCNGIFRKIKIFNSNKKSIKIVYTNRKKDDNI